MTYLPIRPMRALALPVVALSLAVAPSSAAVLSPSSVTLPAAPHSVQPIPVIGDAFTAKIVNVLVQTDNECTSIPFEYRVDCVLQGYKQAVRATPNNRDYRGIKSNLQKAQRKLNRLVKANLDPAAPPLKVGNKTYRAVKKSVAKSLNAQAATILQETATKLIRSAGNSEKRKLHYTRVAVAVQTNTKIFRS